MERRAREATPEAEALEAQPLLDQLDVPVAAATLTTTSGRRYEIASGDEADRVTIRSRGGEVVLRIEITDAGPVLSFTGASVELSATKKLRMAAEEVAIEAAGDLSVRAGGHHHQRVDGDVRVEARNLELQASTGGASVRAAGRIALDGEHIGLNDDPLPQPFGWSAIAEEE
jgi:hypothetical protein